MIARMLALLRTVAKRLTADWLILTAAALTIALSTVLLATGPIYADAVSLSSLQRSLASADASESAIAINQRLHAADVERVDDLVRTEVGRALRVTGAEISMQAETESFELPIETDSDVPAIAAIQHFEDIASHATIIDGRWPEPGERIELAISAAAAEGADISVGRELTLTGRRVVDFEVEAVVVGVFDVPDPNAAFWLGDPLLRVGVDDGNSFRAIGPIVTDLETLLEDLLPGRASISWSVRPLYENLLVSEVPALRRAVEGLTSSLNTAFQAQFGSSAAGASEIAVDTDLATLLSDARRSLTITRSSVLALVFQLAVLAGYALVLTAGLISETRRSETALLRSRGASPGHLVSASILEALVLTAPIAFAAPYLAARIVDALDTWGPLADISLDLTPQPSAEAFALAAIAALGAVIALALPTLRTARSFHSSTMGRRRQESRSLAQRAGVDLALLVVAAAIVWQLVELGPALAARVQGRFGVDPLLVVAPAVGLLTGSVLALRIVPLLAGVAERIAAAGRTVVPALSAWQVARRPVRYARSSLLLVMAVGIGIFTASYSTTWLLSQRHQSDFDVGADMVVQASPSRGDRLTSLQLIGAHESVEGVTASMPLNRELTRLERIEETGFVGLLDASRAPEVVRIRDDLAPAFTTQMETLVAARPVLGGIEIPGTPDALGLEVAVNHLPDPDSPDLEPVFVGRMALIVQDSNDILHRLTFGQLVPDLGPQRLETSLIPTAGESDAPSYPLRLVSIELTSVIPDAPARDLELIVESISHRQPGGPWDRLDFDASPAAWSMEWTDTVTASQLSPSLRLSAEAEPSTLALNLHTGRFVGGVPTAGFSLRPAGSSMPEAIPVLVTQGFLEKANAEIGDQLRLSSLRIDRDLVEIVGTIEEFPTFAADSGEVFIADLPTVQMAGLTPTGRLVTASEYWLALSGSTDDVATVLSGEPFHSLSVESRASRFAALASDPVALGIIGALALGFVAAAIFAVIGFAVSATVSARERLTEIALLRALGLSPGQLGRWLAGEQAMLVLVSIGLGTLIGLLLTAVILPLVSLTQSGSAAFPPVEVVFPWDQIVRLDTAVLVSLAVVVVAMTFAMRRIGLGSALRMGEDR